jgi:tetratricopeptide (TPR) repeat protein
MSAALGGGGIVSSVVDETPGQRAREALGRHAWSEAYEVMTEADGAGDLAPDDLEVLAQAAWWVGQQDAASEAWERAYTLHARSGDKLAAANAAAQLAFNLLGAGLPSVLNGWVNRAERLLQGASEEPVHAFIAVVRGMTAFTGGDLDSAAAAGRRALDIGTTFGIPDLQAMGLHLEGRALVAKGRVEEGMALLDEATAAAVSGELSPQVTGRVYCSTVSACWGLADSAAPANGRTTTPGTIPTRACRCCSWPRVTSRPQRPRSGTPWTTPRRMAISRRPPTPTCSEPAFCRPRWRSPWRPETSIQPRAAADELERIAETYGAVAMRASAGWTRGLVQLAEGRAEASQQRFRHSAALWAQLDAPYETARARMALADAYRAGGNEGRAVLEYRAALAVFDRLGASPDARLATEALGQEAAARPAPRRVDRTFMFTDIVRSTNLVEALGDESWGHLIRWHDEQLRSQFAAHRGEVVKAIGDGFFVAFQRQRSGGVRGGHSTGAVRAPPGARVRPAGADRRPRGFGHPRGAGLPGQGRERGGPGRGPGRRRRDPCQRRDRFPGRNPSGQRRALRHPQGLCRTG